MSADELLLELDQRGIRLEAAGDRLRYHPRTALPPELLARLRTHKGDVLALLGRSATPTARLPPSASCRITAEPTKPVCLCGARTCLDVPIHGGQSVRRDCGGCGRFIDFVVWRGR
jgi:hypothetical protein